MWLSRNNSETEMKKNLEIYNDIYIYIYTKNLLKI